MKLFGGKANNGNNRAGSTANNGSIKTGDYAPEETPLGPRTYPKVGGKPGVLATFGRRKWLWIGGILTGLIIIVVVVLFVQRAGQGSLASNVGINISGPDRVSLGSDISYQIDIANNAGVGLEEGKLILIYPEGFSFTTAEPKADNTQGTEYSLPSIPPGSVASLTISGRLTGGVKTEKVLIARFQFNAIGDPQRLQVEQTFTTTIETAAFSFEAEGPSTALPNNEVIFNVDLTNNESEPLQNLQVRIQYPGGFDFTTATPPPTREESQWDVDLVGIGEKKEFEIKGILGGNVNEVKRFIFSAGLIDQNGNFLKQTEIEKTVKLTQPSVTINQTVDGKTEAAVDPNQTLSYTIEFTNTGPSNLSNLSLELPFTAGVWDTSKLIILNGGALKGSVIRWDGVKVPELRNLEPGQKGRVQLTVLALNTLTVDDAGDKNFATTSTPRVTIGNTSVDGNAVTVKYRAQISAGVSSKIVAGANPPAVGQETIYEITWSLTNLYSDLSGARYVGGVPATAEFVGGSGHVSAGEDLVYNTTSRQLLWNIGKVPANVGKLSPSLTATFRVRVTPGANAAGNEVLLLTNQEFTAKDLWANQDRKEEVPDVETQSLL